MIPGICIEKNMSGHSTRESLAVQIHAMDLKLPCLFVSDAGKVPAGWMAMGGVEFVEAVMGKTIVPENFPLFCKELVGRKWWIEEQEPSWGKTALVKPADRHKRFPATLCLPGNAPASPPWIVQETVKFLTEYRYYINAGNVTTASWYPTVKPPASGDNPHELQTNEPEVIPEAPPLPPSLNIPSDWHGTLDFGETHDGRFLLVEAHTPYACGWYGEQKDNHLYASWLISGWESLKTKPIKKLYLGGFPPKPPECR